MKPPKIAPSLMSLRPCPGENGPDHEHLADVALLFDRAAGADRALAAECEEALQVRMRRDQVERGLAAVVDVFSDAVSVADRLHVRVFDLQVGDRRVGPSVVQRNRKRADEDPIFPLAAHRLREQLRMRLAEAFGRGEFEVPILVLDARALVRDDLDACLARLVEHGLERLFVVRNDADHVDLLGDEIFDRAHLQRRICAGRPNHERVDAVLGALFLDAGLHGVEPRECRRSSRRCPSWACPRRMRPWRARRRKRRPRAGRVVVAENFVMVSLTSLGCAFAHCGSM